MRLVPVTPSSDAPHEIAFTQVCAISGSVQTAEYRCTLSRPVEAHQVKTSVTSVTGAERQQAAAPAAVIAGELPEVTQKLTGTGIRR